MVIQINILGILCIMIYERVSEFIRINKTNLNA